MLERRLAAIRKGQEGLSRTVGELNMAISGAGASLRALKSAAGEAAQTLDERLRRARLHIDELSVLVSSAERIATRLEQGTGTVRTFLEKEKDGREWGAPEKRENGKRENAERQNNGRDQTLILPSSSIMSRLDSQRVTQ